MNPVVKELIEKSTQYLTDIERYPEDVKFPHLLKEDLVFNTVEKCCQFLEEKGMVETTIEIKQLFGMI